MAFSATAAMVIDQVPWPDRSGPKGHQCLRIMAASPTRELTLTTTITFTPSKPKGHDAVPYEQYRRQHTPEGSTQNLQVIQAEAMVGKDARFTVSEKKVGAKTSIYNWNDPGQTLSARIGVGQAGWYRIMLKCCTGANHGIPVRSVAIDGKIPFREAASLVFESSGGWSNETDDWEMRALGVEAVPGGYAFFFTKGMHTLELVNEEGGGLNVDYVVLYPGDMPKAEAIKRVDPTRVD